MKYLQRTFLIVIILVLLPIMTVEAAISQVTLKVVGDIMVHDVQYITAYDYSTKEYDFDPMFQWIKKILEADVLVGNLETTFGGEEVGYSSYPRFNTPDSLATTLNDCGFDLLFTANNHSLDKAVFGLRRTLDILDQNNILHTGTFKTPEDRLKPAIFVAQGISFGFLNYTYGTNGLVPPAGQEYVINMIDLDLIKEDITHLREQVDMLIVGLHFGEEYQRQPNRQQKHLAREVALAGADIILGSHAHVLQPYEFIQVEGREVFVVYSLGNFVSGQKGRYKDSGAILELKIEKTSWQKRPSIVKVDFTPIWVRRFHENNRLQMAIIPVLPDILEKISFNEHEFAILKQVQDDVEEMWSPQERWNLPADLIRLGKIYGLTLIYPSQLCLFRGGW